MMSYQIRCLLNRLERWHKNSFKQPSIEAAAAHALPPLEITWTLIGLIHYRIRKDWAWNVFQTSLRDRVQHLPEQVAIEDVLTISSKGIVPSLPEWEYLLDGDGSSLIHRGTGEQILRWTPKTGPAPKREKREGGRGGW
jgi:hypothetical protein